MCAHCVDVLKATCMQTMYAFGADSSLDQHVRSTHAYMHAWINVPIGNMLM